MHRVLLRQIYNLKLASLLMRRLAESLNGSASALPRKAFCVDAPTRPRSHPWRDHGTKQLQPPRQPDKGDRQICRLGAAFGRGHDDPTGPVEQPYSRCVAVAVLSAWPTCDEEGYVALLLQNLTTGV